MTHQGAEPGRELRVDTLARVEGEGAMRVVLRDGNVADVQLRIYEPPRFFEALLRGRGYTEPPDITSRICGICPVAYQMSACEAIEDACRVRVPEEIRLMRRLLYCGEWIESHTLHVYMLHAPDFLGYPGAIEMAKDHRDVVERGLRLKKAGNALMSLVGGRAVHPVNVKVGGFYRLPDRSRAAGLAAAARTGARRRARHRRAGGRLRVPGLRAAIRVPLAAHRPRLPARVGLFRYQQRPGVPGRSVRAPG